MYASVPPRVDKMAAVSNGSVVDVSWGAVKQAVGYTVYWCLSSLRDRCRVRDYTDYTVFLNSSCSVFTPFILTCCVNKRE